MEVTEQQLAAAAVAPRISQPDIDANIASEHYFTAAQGVEGTYQGPVSDEVIPAMKTLKLLTFCVIVLKNGFTVTGESACASPENFNAEIGKQLARKAAVGKIWPLMGYALRNDLHQAELLKGALA